MKTIMQEGSSN